MSALWVLVSLSALSTGPCESSWLALGTWQEDKILGKNGQRRTDRSWYRKLEKKFVVVTAREENRNFEQI
jgi:hypothetical protein